MEYRWDEGDRRSFENLTLALSCGWLGLLVEALTGCKISSVLDMRKCRIKVACLVNFVRLYFVL